MKTYTAIYKDKQIQFEATRIEIEQYVLDHPEVVGVYEGTPPLDPIRALLQIEWVTGFYMRSIPSDHVIARVHRIADESLTSEGHTLRYT